MGAIEGLRRAEVHGDTMVHHVVLIQSLIEDLECVVGADHVVSGVDFKPVD
jgi:hypothetical protein